MHIHSINRCKFFTLCAALINSTIIIVIQTINYLILIFEYCVLDTCVKLNKTFV